MTNAAHLCLSAACRLQCCNAACMLAQSCSYSGAVLKTREVLQVCKGSQPARPAERRRLSHRHRLRRFLHGSNSQPARTRAVQGRQRPEAAAGPPFRGPLALQPRRTILSSVIQPYNQQPCTRVWYCTRVRYCPRVWYCTWVWYCSQVWYRWGRQRARDGGCAYHGSTQP